MSASDCTVLHADWPSQSEYVTAVGSTFLTPNAQRFCYLPSGAGGASCLEQPLGEISVSIDNGLFWTTGGGERVTVVRMCTAGVRRCRWPTLTVTVVASTASVSCIGPDSVLPLESEVAVLMLAITIECSPSLGTGVWGV